MLLKGMVYRGVRRGAGGAVLRYSAFAVILSCMAVAIPRAEAANPQTIADVQCMVVGARLSESADQRQRMSGEMLLSYFLGRIDGRSPSADLEVLMKRVGKISESDFRRAAKRCGAEFSARGAQIARIGKSLSQLGD